MKIKSSDQFVNEQIELAIRNKLSGLDLSNQDLSQLPSAIGKLVDLTYLNVSGNQLTSLPIEIGYLINLRRLNIGNNHLTSLPPQISYLKYLQVLDVRNNNLNVLPPDFDSLYSLQELYFQYNDLSVLPERLLRLYNLEILNLSNNPLPIPPEIRDKVAKSETILKYYYSTTKNIKKPLNEIKLIFVGQGSVGKTSLVNRLIDNVYNEKENKTEGISIRKWQSRSLQSQKKKIDLRINVWDFGGQEIMHATHQFFLTRRSLYILILDARLGQEDNRVEYWLRMIQSFGGASPVIIVGNKIDQHPLDIDKTGLKKKFPSIIEIFKTSAETGEGIPKLRAGILKAINKLPYVRDPIPATWFDVKSHLEGEGKNQNFITHDEYVKLCVNNNITDIGSQQTLIGFLHDLGIVLHFQDDPRLVELGILNPQWVTNGVYKILNSHILFQNQGVLTLSLLNQILDLTDYPENKRLFLIHMMKKFELCYDIEAGKSFLIPDLLPKDEPYTGEWENVLAFQIHYNILPSNIISRFIVRMNEYIHKTIWRTGVILKQAENTALVKADIEDKKIYIWVSGKRDTRRDLLAIIRREFEKIHRTIAKIEVTEKVPIPNIPEVVAVDYEFLIQLEREGRESLPVLAGEKVIDILVKEVLSRIESQRKTEIHIHGNVSDTNLNVGDNSKLEINDKKKTRKKKS